MFCGGHDNGNIKVWMQLIHSRLHTKAVALVQRAVQVHANQEKMEDDDWNGRSHSALQRYEDNYAPIKHRKRYKKALLKFLQAGERRQRTGVHLKVEGNSKGRARLSLPGRFWSRLQVFGRWTRWCSPSFGVMFTTIQSTQMEMPKVEQTVISQQTWCSSNNMSVGHVPFMWVCAIPASCRLGFVSVTEKKMSQSVNDGDGGADRAVSTSLEARGVSNVVPAGCEATLVMLYPAFTSTLAQKNLQI